MTVKVAHLQRLKYLGKPSGEIMCWGVTTHGDGAEGPELGNVMGVDNTQRRIVEKQ